MLACIEWFRRTIQLEALPIGVFLHKLLYQFFSSPPAWLIHVPGQLNHGDRTELSVLDKIRGCVIVLSATTLRSDLNNFIRSLYFLERNARIVHCFSERFFHICIAACPDCFSSMKGMGKVRSADNHSIDRLAVVHLFIIAEAGHRMAHLFA